MDFMNFDLTAMYNGWVAQQNMQMQTICDGIVQQNMQNPHIQMAYQRYMAQGGGVSFPQFAYNWAATNGFSPEGMAHYRQTELVNQGREQMAWAGLQDAERQRAAAIGMMNQHFSHNQNTFGHNLMGQAAYATPVGPQIYSYNLGPGYHHTPYGQIYVDPYRQYHWVDAHGYHHLIQQHPNLPFR